MTQYKTLKRMIPRRQALKSLGALALSGPSIAAISCSKVATGDVSSASSAGNAAPRDAGSEPAVAGTAASPVQAGAAGHAAAASVQTTPARAGSGAGAGAPAAAAAAASGVGGQPAQAGASPAVMAAGSGGVAAQASADFIPVMFDAAASCTLTPTDPAGEGPFFIHEDEVMNDTELLRSDMREKKPGIELQLNLRLLDSDGMCMKPIAGVEVYTWHTDALGLYSGFAGQNPDQPYMGAGERTVENMDRFCRGLQHSDEQGIVRFKTVYPGWYNGRAIHIHFLALRPGSGPGTMSYRSKQYMVFTTQMYFAESFSRMIHENNEPYKQRASGMAYSSYVKPQNMTVNPSMSMQGQVAVGTLNIVTAASGSRR